MARASTHSVFAHSFAAALQHATIASMRQVLDLGCGCGCWSLLLAGPRLHVTVVVSSAEARKQALRIARALAASSYVTVLQCSDVETAESFLSVLGDSAAVRQPGFMGFEMVFMLELLTQLPPVLIDRLSAALQPYMHSRSKALLTVLGVSAVATHATSEWYGVHLSYPPVHGSRMSCAGMSPIVWRLPCAL
jgi:hypothetical protein